MKKILLSLIIIGAVGAVVAGVTTAYFGDTEVSVGNKITAGTIDIEIDDTNPWTGVYSVPDLKPGETDYINFGIENVGTNGVEIYKKIYGMDGTGGTSGFCGVSSQPEFKAEGGTFWSSGSCNKTAWVPIDNIQTRIYYDLSVKIYENKTSYTDGDAPIWWQMIESGNRAITTVYPDDNTYIDLGMLPVGNYMFVEQSYHFDKDAGDEYQGDELIFNMEIKGEQLAQGASGDATVVLENKSGAPDWAIISGDGIQGTLTYKTKASNFEYSFTGTVNTGGINYTLIYVGTSGDYPCTGSKFIGYGLAQSNGAISFNGTLDLGIDIVGGKVWLVPSSTYNGSSYSDGVMNGWNHANNLYETSLVNYDDIDN